MSCELWPCEDEAQTYLNKYKIIELLDNLTAQVLFHRPDNPQEFMIDQLEQLKRCASTQQDYPCLLDDGNVDAVFRMLDAEGRGFITTTQLTQAMHSLGVRNFTPRHDVDRITLDIFSREVKQGLLTVSATVGPG